MMTRPETRIVVEQFVETVEWDYPQFHLTMHCYLCHVESGHLELKEYEAARWLNKDELESVNWLPADKDVVRKLDEIPEEKPMMAAEDVPDTYNCFELR